jgi:hypothetical protein
MPPRPLAPRLAELDADVVATDVCVALVEHADRLRALVSTSTHPHHRTVRAFPIHARLRRLVTFAQTGDAVVDDVEGTLRLLVEGYFWGAGRWTGEPVGATDSFATVFIASRARLGVAAGDPVARQGLAALAGIHPSRVDALSAGKGPLRRVRGPGSRSGLITAASARAWLQAQRVPGFEGEASR